jgi:hypothetical protein
MFEPQPEVTKAIRKAKNGKAISLHMKLWVRVICGDSSVANNLACVFAEDNKNGKPHVQSGRAALCCRIT